MLTPGPAVVLLLALGTVAAFCIVLAFAGVNPLALLQVAGAALVIVGLLAWAIRRQGGFGQSARTLRYASVEGHHHSFAGVQLRVEDDGRHMWVDGAGLMRATGQRESEAALAARHAGHWRRDARGVLMLRVDAVVQQLHHGRGRHDPRILKLKHYFEREVLRPAALRHQRSGRAPVPPPAPADAAAAEPPRPDAPQPKATPGADRRP